MWEDLPEVTLGHIFSHLGYFDKIHVHGVCQSWQKGLARPEVWHTFVYSDDYVLNELIHGETCISNLKKFNKVKQGTLSCIQNYGHLFRKIFLSLKGEASFDVLREISKFCVHLNQIHLSRSVNVELPTDFRKNVHDILSRNCKLQEITIENVTLKSLSNNDPLPIGLRHSQNLQKLTLVNSFPCYSLSSLMYLVNLQELTINPHNLNHSLIDHLASSSLTRLNIVANRQTKEFFFENLSEQQWQDLSCHKNLQVHCYMGVSYDWAEKYTLLRPNIPLVTLVYRKCMWLQYGNLSRLLVHYANSLEEFVDYSIHEGSYRNDMETAQDVHIIKIVQACQNLHTLAVKETLSSSSILLIAFLCPNLKHFYVREDMVRYKFDLQEDIVVPREVVDLIINNWEQKEFQAAMSQLLGTPWKLLDKLEFIDTLQGKYASFL